MKRLVSFLLLALLLITIVSCEHNVYLDDKKDLPSDIWCVGTQQNGNFFKTANEAINFIISQGMTKSISVDENCTIHLLRHVLSEDSDAIAMYGKQYVLPEKYRKDITVPERFEGTLCIDFGGYRYDFANNIDYFFIVKGGSAIYIYNGDSVIFKESQSPITNPALVVGTRTVTIDEHLIDDRRVGPENEAPAAVLVTEKGTLVITCEKEQRANTGVNGTFEVEKGGKLLIEEGTVTINDVLEEEKSDITIIGGEIHNPHEIDARISETIPENRKQYVDRKVIHSPLKHFAAKQPTCLEDGNIEFWQCQNDDCLKYFSDIDCTNEISLSDTKVLRLKHNLIHKDGTESTCTEHGHLEHWVCQSCGKFFLDSSATTEKKWVDLQLELKPHNFNNNAWLSDNTHHWHECSVCHTPQDYSEHEWNDGVVIEEASSHHDGTRRYTCKVCGKIWDKAIPAHDHAYGETYVVNPTCTEYGYSWHQCSVDSCQQITIIPDSYVDSLNHKNNQKTERKDASCTENGNIEYWYCPDCGKYSDNVQFTHIIEVKDTVIKALGHDFNPDVWTYGTDSHWHLCLRDGCNAHISEASHNTGRLCQDAEQGHHWECTVCDYPTSIQAHIWGIDNRCTVCGFTKPQEPQGGGGFDVQIIMREPNGYLDYSYPEDECTVTYHDSKTEYKATKFEWYLNGVKQEQSETKSSFTFVPSGPYSHVVMCMYSNDYGIGSVTKVIDGK